MVYHIERMVQTLFTPKMQICLISESVAAGIRFLFHLACHSDIRGKRINKS